MTIETIREGRIGHQKANEAVDILLRYMRQKSTMKLAEYSLQESLLRFKTKNIPAYPGRNN